jgi:hypothetical protein
MIDVTSVSSRSGTGSYVVVLQADCGDCGADLDVNLDFAESAQERLDAESWSGGDGESLLCPSCLEVSNMIEEAEDLGYEVEKVSEDRWRLTKDGDIYEGTADALLNALQEQS